MNKQELLSTYTAEQLADMVVKLDIASEISAKHIYVLENKINNLEEENGRLQAKVDTYNKFLLPRCTKEAKEMIDHNSFGEVMIVTYEQWSKRAEETQTGGFISSKEYEEMMKKILNIDTSEIKDDCHRFGIESLQRYLSIDSLKKQDKETDKISVIVSGITKSYSIDEIGDIIRSYEDIKQCKEHNGDHLHSEEYLKIISLNNEISGLKKEVDARKAQIEKLKSENEELKSENAELHCEMQAMSMFPDEFPTEPIKIADMLIDNAAAVYESYVEDYAKANAGQLVIGNPCEDVRRQTISYLRQIAEHLLVYCNHNEETKG